MLLIKKIIKYEYLNKLKKAYIFYRILFDLKSEWRIDNTSNFVFEPRFNSKFNFTIKFILTHFLILFLNFLSLICLYCFI